MKELITIIDERIKFLKRDDKYKYKLPEDWFNELEWIKSEIEKRI